MKKFIYTLIAVFFIIFIGMAGVSPLHAADNQRIVSLSPSITEILFHLGVGDRVVGVTKYCDYPAEAKQKESVGGLIDPNFEIIYRLEPDLVIFHTNESGYKDKFEDMGLNILETDARSVKGILESIHLIGQAIEREQEAKALIKKIQDKINDLKDKTKDLPKPRVMMTYSRPVGQGKINEVYIAGNKTFFNDFITIAGGENVYQGPQLITSPIISTEGILQMNPDIIIELTWTQTRDGLTIEEIIKDWESLPQITAYQNKRIHVLNKKYIGVPGPRITETMDDMVRLIHPDIQWD